MGQSLVQNYIHLIFSTKHRQPLIQPTVEADLHAYLGGICNRFDSQPIIIGGFTDHMETAYDAPSGLDSRYLLNSKAVTLC